MNFKRFLFLVFIAAQMISCGGCARSYESEKGFVRIPVHFSPDTCSSAVEVEVEIEGLKYALQIDTGEFYDLTLQKEILDKLEHKESIGLSEGFDVKGNRFASPTFSIPNIKIGGLEFLNVVVLEEDNDFLTEKCVVWRPQGNPPVKERISGRIGRGILQRHNLLILFPNALFFDLENEPSFLHDFTEILCEMDTMGTIVTVETDLGAKRFLLDSGTNHSALNQGQVEESELKAVQPGKWKFTTEKFLIGGRDFGAQHFYSFDVKLRFPNFDGILGIDFFLDHSIYLDFQNQKAFIKSRS